MISGLGNFLETSVPLYTQGYRLRLLFSNGEPVRLVSGNSWGDLIHHPPRIVAQSPLILIGGTGVGEGKGDRCLPVNSVLAPAWHAAIEMGLVRRRSAG